MSGMIGNRAQYAGRRHSLAATAAARRRCDNSLQPRARFCRDGGQVRVLDDAHHADRVGDLDACARLLVNVGQSAHDDVAGQEEADVWVGGNGAMGERWIARAKDDIRGLFDAQLGFQCRLDINGGQHAEALCLERFGYAGYGVFNAQVEGASESVYGAGYVTG